MTPVLSHDQRGNRPTIYCFINSEHPTGVKQVVAMSQAGRIIASDYGQAEFDCRRRIGLGSMKHHDQYALAHPNGYVLMWIHDPGKDDELQRVIKMNQTIDMIEESL